MQPCRIPPSPALTHETYLAVFGNAFANAVHHPLDTEHMRDTKRQRSAPTEDWQIWGGGYQVVEGSRVLVPGRFLQVGERSVRRGFFAYALVEAVACNPVFILNKNKNKSLCLYEGKWGGGRGYRSRTGR
jgi:hypothetical protein